MRCVRCGGRSGRLRVGRGPDGRLLFDWCDDCLTDVHTHALRGGGGEVNYDSPRRQVRSEAEIRAVGLRMMGLVLAVWGLVLDIVGMATWLGVGPADNGFGPSRLSRLHIFSWAGGVLAVAGAWVGLSSLDRVARRRSMARAIEAVSIGLGLGVLILGIAFHEPRRDPWIVAVVALACLGSWAARHWSTPRDTRAGRVAP